MVEAFAQINPTDPLMLAKQAARRNEIDPIPLVFRWPEPMLHGEHVFFHFIFFHSPFFLFAG
jgi:hypothetical protein